MVGSSDIGIIAISSGGSSIFRIPALCTLTQGRPVVPIGAHRHVVARYILDDVQRGNQVNEVLIFVLSRTNDGRAVRREASLVFNADENDGLVSPLIYSQSSLQPLKHRESPRDTRLGWRGITPRLPATKLPPNLTTGTWARG